LIIGFVGIFLVVGIDSFKGNINLFSVGEVIIGSMSYSLATSYVNHKVPHINVMAINQIALTMTAIFYLPLAIATWPAHAIHIKTFVMLVVLGLLPTALAFVLFFGLIRSIGAARGSLVTYLNTAFAVILGIFILHESLSTGIVVGLPLILLGSYLASKKNSVQEKN